MKQNIVSFESVNRFDSLANICEFCSDVNCICNNNNNISSNMTYFNSDSASSHKPVEQCSDDDNSENNSQSIYDLSTLIENNVVYDNTTNENNSYDKNSAEVDIAPASGKVNRP